MLDRLCIGQRFRQPCNCAVVFRQSTRLYVATHIVKEAHINFYCRKRETLKTEIRYVLDNSISVDERVLFPTKELLKSL